MMKRDEGGQLSDFIGGGHHSYEGEHKAHRGDPPSLPPTRENPDHVAILLYITYPL